jgi:hypothetical protein
MKVTESIAEEKIIYQECDKDMVKAVDQTS